MKAKEEKQLLEGKKNAIKMLSMDDTDTIVLVTNNGTAVTGTPDDVCRGVAKLFAVLKANNFPGLEIMRDTINFVCLSEEEQKKFVKDELKDMIKKIDEIDKKKKKKND